MLIPQNRNGEPWPFIPTAVQDEPFLKLSNRVEQYHIKVAVYHVVNLPWFMEFVPVVSTSLMKDRAERYDPFTVVAAVGVEGI